MSAISSEHNEAIDLFEKAIDKESTGLMSDAVDLYRKAFKLDDKVDLLYRKHKIAKHNQEVGKGKQDAVHVDEEKVNAINADVLVKSFAALDLEPVGTREAGQTESSEATEEVDSSTDEQETSPLMNLPRDIWIYILEILLESHPESWVNFSLTCRRNCYWGFGTNNIWRRLCHLVYTNQAYEENNMYLSNVPLGKVDDVDLPIPLEQFKILPQYQNSWKYMLQNRPYLKFHGCYISVVNYYSEGGRPEFSSSWNNPIKVVTYYRYLRFYPKGECYMVLSKLEPKRVVPYLSKHNMAHGLKDISEDPSSHTPHQVNETHKIYKGRWTISISGEVHVLVANGSVPYYNFHYFFQIKSLGKAFRHSKLHWSHYYGVRKKMHENDDREGERVDFSLKNETSFKFSRVKKYTTDT